MTDRGGAAPAIVELTLTRLREFVREPEALFWIFLFPALMAGALGVAFRSGGDDRITVGVRAGEGAAAVVQALEPRGFTVRAVPPGEIDTALRRAQVPLVVVPGSPPTYVYDPTRTESRLARREVDEALQRAAGRADLWKAGERVVATPGSRYIDWLIPGLLGMNIMSTGLWGVGFSIVQARTRKLLKRLIASPMRRSEYLAAQILARLAFLALEVGALLLFARFAFGVPMQFSWLLLSVVSVLSALAFGGLGLLVASRARTIEAVSGLLNLVMLPMWILSGVFFASTNFPDAMQPAIQALPLTALNDALRGVMLENAGFADVRGELAIVLAWGAASFGAAVRFFRWR